MEEWMRDPEKMEEYIESFLNAFDPESFQMAWRKIEEEKKQPKSKVPGAKSKAAMFRRGKEKHKIDFSAPPESKEKNGAEDQKSFWSSHLDRITSYWSTQASAKKFKEYTAKGMDFLNRKFTSMPAADPQRARDARMDDYQIVLQHFSVQLFKNLVSTLYTYIKWASKWIGQGLSSMAPESLKPGKKLSSILSSVGKRLDQILTMAASGVDKILFVASQLLALMITWPPLFSLLIQIADQLLQAACGWIQKTRGLVYIRSRAEAWKQQFASSEEEKNFVKNSLLYAFAEVGSVVANAFSSGKMELLGESFEILFRGILRRIIHGIVLGTMDGLACLTRCCFSAMGCGSCVSVVSSCLPSPTSGSDLGSSSGASEKASQRIVQEVVDVTMECLLTAVSRTGLSMRSWVFLTGDNVYRFGKFISRGVQCLSQPVYQEASLEEALEDPLILSTAKASQDVQRVEESWNPGDFAHRQTVSWLKKLTGQFYLGADHDPIALDLILEHTQKQEALSKEYGSALNHLVMVSIMGAPVLRQHLYGQQKSEETQRALHQIQLTDMSKLLHKTYDDWGRIWINALPLRINRNEQKKWSGFLMRLLSVRPSIDSPLWPRLVNLARKHTGRMVTPEGAVEAVETVLTFVLTTVRDLSQHEAKSQSAILTSMVEYEEWVRNYLVGKAEDPVLPTHHHHYEIFSLYLYLEARERRRPYPIPSPLNKGLLMMDVFETKDRVLDKQAARLVLYELAGTEACLSTPLTRLTEAMNLTKMDLDVPPSEEATTLGQTLDFLVRAGKMETREATFQACVQSIQGSGDKYKQFVLDRVASSGGAAGTEEQMVSDFVNRYIQSKVRYILAQKDVFLRSDIQGGPMSRAIGQAVSNAVSTIMGTLMDLNRIRHGASLIHYQKLVDVETQMHQAIAFAVQAIRLVT